MFRNLLRFMFVCILISAYAFALHSVLWAAERKLAVCNLFVDPNDAMQLKKYQPVDTWTSINLWSAYALNPDAAKTIQVAYFIPLTKSKENSWIFTEKGKEIVHSWAGSGDIQLAVSKEQGGMLKYVDAVTFPTAQLNSGDIVEYLRDMKNESPSKDVVPGILVSKKLYTSAEIKLGPESETVSYDKVFTRVGLNTGQGQNLDKQTWTDSLFGITYCGTTQK